MKRSSPSQTRHDRTKDGVARVIVALGDDFESANAAAMYHARRIVHGGDQRTGVEQEEIKALTEGVKPQWMANWFDGLSYCESPSLISVSALSINLSTS